MRRFGWMIVLLIMVGCSVNSENSQQQPIITESGKSLTVFPNYIAIIVPCYELTCLAEPFLSIQTDAGWHRLEDFIMGQHYLDDQLTTSFGMCDLVVCNKIDQDHPVGINLKLYDHVGERQHCSIRRVRSKCCQPIARSTRISWSKLTYHIFSMLIVPNNKPIPQPLTSRSKA
ncbi:hypothetical protein [Herpetosiphon giganteus]|uniref:hypothetical protein n=1 Tax=Herpetosiphon giganteus TaxID=2029754 RepID=UPI00195E1437|nr:hypothetical protein [Herpetosiphon giganteus]MBM7845446.1 hypothetical protein [Herpetosiphon giganteus]